MRNIKKRIAAFALIAGLCLSHAVTVLAADISVGNYVFVMALRACGVSPGSKAGAWKNAFEGYLEKTGKQALLNQVKGYDRLSWGDTVEGVDSLYWSVREWLSSASVREAQDGSYLYQLPSFPGPHPDTLSIGDEPCIFSEPFSDPPSFPSDQAGDYAYLYSDMYVYQTTRSTLYHRNMYAPKDIEIFGVVIDYGTNARVRVNFFTPDSTSSTGYRQVTLKCVAIAYYLDTGDVYGRFSNPIDVAYEVKSVRAIMNFPFRVFGSPEAAENYCKTGTVSDLFTEDAVTLSSYGEVQGADTELINQQVDSVSSTMTLPDSAAAANTNLSSLQQSMDVESLSSALASAGMEVSYTAGYKVEHYKQDVSVPDKPEAWIKMSEESLSGIVGAAPSITPKSYPNFLYAPELTEPQNSKILSDGSLVIRLYYKPDPDAKYSYTIEYHKDGEVFKTVSGSVPVFGEHTITECEDFCPQYYLPDTKASTSLPFEVTEQNNTIHIYYKRDPSAVFLYTVEYYKDGEAFKTVSGSVSVFSDRMVASCQDFCPRYYLPDTSASTPLPFEVTEDNHVIQIYYKRDLSAVLPYTVEYHKDGEVFKTVSGSVPVFGEHTVTECRDFCPQYYLPDTKASTSLPFEVTENENTIQIYYKRDLSAVFSYTAEYYKDGELFKTVPGTVSVFDPSVKSCVTYCPSGYVLDTSSSTPLPYTVPESGGVVKNYYVKKDSVISYTVEYYRDGLRKNTYSGNVPAASPVVQSCPSYCPEYYKIDSEHSDTFPYTLGDTSRNRIRIYYKKDEDAVFPYTVECYKDGELVETASKTISVFDPAVKEYGFDCPEGYVVDTSSSTSLPYSISKDGNVIKYHYIDEEKSLSYTVEYYKDGEPYKTMTGNVSTSSPMVEGYWPYNPEGYILDESASDSLPFHVTAEDNVIHAYYIPDPSNPIMSVSGGFSDVVKLVTNFLRNAVLWILTPILLIIMIRWIISSSNRITSEVKPLKPKLKKKKRIITAPKSKFMKGVHANKGLSMKWKANLKHHEREYFKPDLRRPHASDKHKDWGM